MVGHLHLSAYLANVVHICKSDPPQPPPRAGALVVASDSKGAIKGCNHIVFYFLLQIYEILSIPLTQSHTTIVTSEA